MEYVCEAGVFPQISISMLHTRVNMCTCVLGVCACVLVFSCFLFSHSTSYTAAAGSAISWGNLPERLIKFLSVCLSVRLSVCPSVSLSLCLSLSLSIFIYFDILIFGLLVHNGLRVTSGYPSRANPCGGERVTKPPSVVLTSSPFSTCTSTIYCILTRSNVHMHNCCVVGSTGLICITQWAKDRMV